AMSYVEGFNAADATRVSSVALRESEKDEERIQATKLGRLANGYDGITRWLSGGLDPTRVELRLSTIATELHWRRGRVRLVLKARTGEALESIEAKRAIVALPLGVLKARPDDFGAIRFSPELPKRKRNALDLLEMGPVVKVLCRFRSAFW